MKPQPPESTYVRDEEVDVKPPLPQKPLPPSRQKNQVTETSFQMLPLQIGIAFLVAIILLCIILMVGVEKSDRRVYPIRVDVVERLPDSQPGMTCDKYTERRCKDASQTECVAYRSPRISCYLRSAK